MVCITLPDGSRREFDHPVSVHEVARSIGTGLGKAALAGRPALAPLLGNATFACLSSRVAGALVTVAGDRIRVSQEPNEEALFRILLP